MVPGDFSARRKAIKVTGCALYEQPRGHLTRSWGVPTSTALRRQGTSGGGKIARSVVIISLERTVAPTVASYSG